MLASVASIKWNAIQNWIADRSDEGRGCGPLGATNASKHLIEQLEDRILQINQSKNASKHS